MNPIKALRKEFNLTQRELAELANMTPTALLRYEQGIYEKPSESIINAFHSINYNDEESVFTLAEQYYDWRIKHQQEAAKYFKELPPLAVINNEHPFTTFRKSISNRAVGRDSRMSFCILLAIHPSVVYDYEEAKQPHMPNLIEHALINAAVGDSYIRSLDQLGMIYCERRTI